MTHRRQVQDPMETDNIRRFEAIEEDSSDNGSDTNSDNGTDNVPATDVYEDESIVDSEYPDNNLQVLTDALITSNGEAIADVMAGIRDALEKLTKVLYNKLSK